LTGITVRLDYLADLGVDAIWLSPIHPSPDMDFGYDISNYCAIDPKFGSMADFDRLVREAELRGIRVVLDLVLNHTSDQHDWFKESRRSRDNPYQDWYLWRDAQSNEQPPNNWLAMIGGSGWEWEPAREQYYFHMYYKQQPDLNWRNPRVRAALMDVLRFWLDRGVKGFRLDVFNLFFKDAQLRGNPRKLIGLRPFDRMAHRYDCDQPEMLDALAEIRSILDGYGDTYAIGETFLSTPEKAAGYCGDQALHQAFNFKFLECPWSAQHFGRSIAAWEKTLGPHNWPNYVLSNHDVPRAASRYGEEDDERLKVAAAMLLTLRGTPFLYYGEEIGMRDIRLSRQEILDPVGRHYWPFYKGRDGCRAPMQWDSSANSGFSKEKPWLPLHPEWPWRNVAHLMSDNDSLLNCFRNLLAIRRQSPSLRSGQLSLLENLPVGVLGYERILPEERIVVFMNFTRSRKVFELPGETQQWKAIFSTQGTAVSGRMDLSGNEALILASAFD
jgi:alpha-glucosidase